MRRQTLHPSICLAAIAVAVLFAAAATSQAQTRRYLASFEAEQVTRWGTIVITGRETFEDELPYRAGPVRTTTDVRWTLRLKPVG